MSYQSILVPLDGSELAEQALPHAVAVARRAHAQLRLIQVVPDAATLATEPQAPTLDVPNLEPLAAPLQYERLQSEWQQQAQESLQQIAEPIQNQGAPIQIVVRNGSPASAIVDYARDEAIDLIVMSTHGRSGLARWIYGSVATRVLHGAPCPVLLIRAAE